MWKKIRTIIRKSPVSIRGEDMNIHTLLALKLQYMKKNCGSDTDQL